LPFKFDVKVIVPLLMVCFDWLNPTTITFVVAIDFARLEFKLEKNVFGAGVLNEESS